MGGRPVKHPLARALHSVGLNTLDVAVRLGVDPKTVQRWIGGRVPYPRHRTALVGLTGWMERDLWPSLAGPLEPQPTHEVRIAYPHRSSVDTDAWRRLFDRAHREIGVLAYSALFLAEDSRILQTLRIKASAGCRVRIVLGDPDGREVAHRGGDEGIDAVMMAARIRNALILFRPLAGLSGVRLRLHSTVLYNSLYLADDELLVNTHVYGCPASHAPLLHLACTEADGMASTYRDSFERVWASAKDA
jgi:hypothetical protein